VSNPLDLVVIAQALFGLAFLLVGARVLRFRARQRAYSGRTAGTVVSLRPQDPAGAALSKASIVAGTARVRFTTADGDERLAEAYVGRREGPIRPGDRVQLLYDPADPQRIRLDARPAQAVLTAVWLLAVGTAIELVAVATAAIAIAATGA